MAVCDLDEAAARETVRLLNGPGSEKGAFHGAHAAFQADVSEAKRARHLLEQVQVNASDLARLKALILPRPLLAFYMGFWCVTSLFHRPAFLARLLSLCPVRELIGLSFCSACPRMTGTKS